MVPASHLVVSGPFSALEERLSQWIREVRSHPLDPLVGIVPSNALRRHLASRLARRMGAVVNVRLSTWLDAARIELGEGLTPLGPGERLVLVRRLLRRSSSPAWRERAEREAFVRSCAAALGDLREAGVDPQDERLADHPGLTDLLGRYRDELAASGRTDREAMLHDAADRLAPDSPLAVEPLFLYGFYDLTPGQKELAAAAARMGPLAFFLPLPGGGADEFAEPLLDWLEREIGVRPEGRCSSDPCPFDETADRLFRLDAEPMPTPPEVRIATAAGPAREADEVCRALLEARGRGIAWRDMAVLLRDRSDLEAPLLRSLRAHGVPHRLRCNEPLLRRPIAASFLDLLACIEDGFPWEPLGRLVASPWLLRPDGSKADLWPRLLRETGVVGGEGVDDPAWREGLRRLREAWDRRLESRRRRTDREDGEIERLREVRDQIDLLDRALAELIEAAGALPARGTPAQLAAALEGLARDRFLPAQRDEAVGDGGPEAWDAVLEVLARFQGHGAPMEMPIGEMVADLRLALAEARLPSPTPPGDRVAVFDLLEARGLHHEVVVLPGLHEGSFPPKIAIDALLPDGLRESLGLRPTSDRHIEERLLFSLAVRSARRRLILTRQRSDAAGRARPASPFERALLRAIHGDAVHDMGALEERLRAGRVLREAPVSPLAPFIEDPPPRSDLSGEAVLSPVARVVLGTLHAAFRPGRRCGHEALADPSARRALECREARRAPLLGSWDGMVVREDEEDLGSILSPTRLEKYSRCPFVYFAGALLGLETAPAHGAFEDVRAMDRGSWTHDVLEAVFRRLSDEDLLPLAREGLPRARRLAWSVAERRMRNRGDGIAGRAPLLWLRELDILRRNLEALLEEFEAGTGWEPILFEASFGFEAGATASVSDGGPLEIELPSGRTLRFRGRIDRIDRHADSGEARVIDYKTGGGTAKGKVRPLRDDKLQLLLYRLAAEDLLLDGESAVTDAIYLYLRDGVVRPREVELLEQDRLLEVLETFAEGIAEGRFFPHPNRTCVWCDYAGICRREPEWRMLRRIEQDERTLPYRRAKGLVPAEEGCAS